MPGKKKTPAWKRIEEYDAAVNFYLTGESVIRGVTVPMPPVAKSPTVVRVTHSNGYGPVDSDIFVRLGDPNEPLDAQDFDTVSDWQKAESVEELVLDDRLEEWVPRVSGTGDDLSWSGTYEAEIQFTKGYNQIEIKVVSREEAVCSIVLSNWKVYVR